MSNKKTNPAFKKYCFSLFVFLRSGKRYVFAGLRMLAGGIWGNPKKKYHLLKIDNEAKIDYNSIS